MMPGDDDDVDPSLVEELAKVERYREVQEAARRRAIDPPAGAQRPRRAKKQGSVKGYTNSGLSNEVDIVRNAPKGERNDKLNTAALKMGGLVAAGELDFDVAVSELRAAALSNGIKEWELKSWDLPERGIRDGMAKGPRDLSNVGQKIAPVINMSKRGSRVPAEITGTPTDLGDDDVDEPDPDERRIILEPLDTVKTTVPAWVWEYEGYGRIQLQTLTMFAGKPAAGKSTAVRWFAARISNGTLPGAWFGYPMKVALYSPEESLSDTLKPSLQAAGANMSNIVNIRPEQLQMKTGMYSKRDQAILTKVLRDNNVRALFVDPVMQTFDSSKVDGHKNVEVRDHLMPYVDIARDINGIVVCVHHLRKGALTDVMEMMNGSSAFGEVARCVFGFANVGEGINVMQQAKNSAGRNDLQIEYKLPVTTLAADDGQDFELPRFEIVGNTEVSISDMGGGSGDEDITTASADVIWLRDYLLENQPAPAKQVWMDAQKETDMSKYRLTKARRKLQLRIIKTPKPDAPNTQAWALPDYTGPNYL